MPSFWLIQHFLGIGTEYIIAAALTAGGIFLAVLFNPADANPVGFLLKPIRYVGFAMVVCGVAYGYGTYRESRGAEACRAAWARAEAQTKIEAMERDLEAQKAAAELKSMEIEDLAKEKQANDEKIRNYEEYVGKLSAAISSCRRATADDNRRVCAIIGPRSSGCKNSR
jgi:hypothetical protein